VRRREEGGGGGEEERETTLQLLISMHHLDPRTGFSDRFSFRGLHGGSRYPGAIFNHQLDSHIRGGREVTAR